MYPCVVCGQQTSVTYGIKSSRWFNQRFEKAFCRVTSYWRKEAHVLGCEYTGRKQIEIDMKEKLLETINAFGENIDEKLTMPVSSHLFVVNEQA